MGLPKGLITNRTARLPGSFRPFETTPKPSRAPDFASLFFDFVKTQGGLWQTIKVFVPWPHSSLTPNARAHWATKAKHAKALRQEAFADARTLHNRSEVLFDKAYLQPVFHYVVNRRRDRDNALASLKAAIDGLADAKIVANDTDFTPWPVEFVKDERRFVELIITGRVE